MLTGKVTSVSREKGFGFIQPATGGPDVFFHITSVVGDFAAIQPGEEVRYETDPEAAKPRASKVERLQGNVPAVVKRPSELGFITRLRKREQLGFISADSGGPELLFGSEDVAGSRRFHHLAVGDSVRFVRGPETDEPGPPAATQVTFEERHREERGPELPPNPKARRRKPTWRR